MMSDLYSIVRSFSDGIFLALIKEDRFMFLVKGFFTSIEITLGATAIGIVLGLIIAIIRMRGKGLLCAIGDGYVTVIRGTPAVVQLTVIYFIILSSSGLPDLLIAAVAFGINSGAYVAEIIRAGISSVDRGQMEAGRSLGLSYAQTMTHIIIPQAIKNVLPALGNEFIVLVKETAVAGYVGIADLNKGGIQVASITYNFMVSGLCVAYIYLCMTISLAAGINQLEKRLHQSD